ncbi:hypothetical protein [Methylobacterium fujisawaense]|jgi:hypothetical protein
MPAVSEPDGAASARRAPLPACFDLLGRALAEQGLFVEIAAGDGAAAILLGASPIAFRSRMIFTGGAPLQRARFPYAAGTRSLPSTFPRA